MLNPVRKAGKFVKKNRVPIAVFAVVAGVVVVYVFEAHRLDLILEKYKYGMSRDMGVMWHTFLKENELYDAWDTHISG